MLARRRLFSASAASPWDDKYVFVRGLGERYTTAH
jgi:hypothetical protein